MGTRLLRDEGLLLLLLDIGDVALEVQDSGVCVCVCVCVCVRACVSVCVVCECVCVSVCVY
jgi:hypothetical protein